MPIYEYGCYDCRKRVNVFFRSFAEVEAKEPVCPRCGGTNLHRLVSQVGIVHSGEGHPENVADSSYFPDSENNDPRALADVMRKARRKLGDMGDEFNEVADRLEAGEAPESIDRDFPTAD